MRIRLLKYLAPVLQPIYRQYFSRARSFRFENIRILVEPGVFFPGLIFSTRLLLEFIRQMDLKDKSVLELGAGSGIISLFAASRGAKVTATDINPAAVKNIRANAAANHLDLTILESDLFEKITNSNFDLIIIAPPYYPKDPANYAEMAWYCGQNFEYFQRLFQYLPGYCHDSNQILMILSEDCNIQHIKEIASKFGLKLNLLSRKKKMGEWNFIFRISREE